MYPTLLPYSSPGEVKNLEDEFLQYQLMNDTDIPSHAWDEAAVVVGEELGRSEALLNGWVYMQTVRSADGKLKFRNTANVALLVLTQPHSNAAEKRVFRTVMKNKTKFRQNLKIDDTHSSILDY